MADFRVFKDANSERKVLVNMELVYVARQDVAGRSLLYIAGGTGANVAVETDLDDIIRAYDAKPIHKVSGEESV